MNAHGAAFTFGTGGVGVRFSRQPYEESVRPWYSEAEDTWIYFLPSGLCADCTIYNDAVFTKNQHEYLPLPQNQISASDGHYQQNIGIW